VRASWDEDGNFNANLELNRLPNGARVSGAMGEALEAVALGRLLPWSALNYFVSRYDDSCSH